MDKICFVDQVFLQNSPLSPDNILEYFARSPFYDSSSINEIVKMQNQYRGISGNDDFSKYKGMYYVVDHYNPENTLFVIRQSINKDNLHTNIAYFYVIHGHIYQAPTQESIYNASINNIFWHLSNTIDFYIDNQLCNINNEEKDQKKDQGYSEDVLVEIINEFKKFDN